MIEIAGLIYDLVKDVKKYLEWKEETKLVDFKWPEYTGFSAKLAESGRTVAWARPDRVERLLHEGCEIAFEIDKAKRIRRRIVLKDGLVLMSKPKA